MALAKSNRPYGKVNKGQTIPYGTLADASQELIKVYYYHGYKEDSMMPELPYPPYEEEPTIDPDEELSKVQLVECVQNILDSLTPREEKVLRLRFGIGMDSDHTLEEVGFAFRVTRERIRQIEAKALRKLKHPVRSGMLRQFISADLYYETTAETQRRIREWQQEWREERNRKALIHKTEKEMSPEKHSLWMELKPALRDAAWVADLKTEKPDMYEELKMLVGDLWGMSAKYIWKKYTGKDL